jgi:hypothetical protein
MIGFAGIAGATLIDRGTSAEGYHLIYDSGFNITWIDFTYGSTGWQNARNWAGGLNVTINGSIYEDWRLPTALNQDNSGPVYGYDVTDSEMGHLFYTELGNKANQGLNNVSIFNNLMNLSYYSCTNTTGGTAWVFQFNKGLQTTEAAYSWLRALAVRDGDVGAPVLEPGTIFLLGTGLIGLIGLRKGKRQKHTV